MKEDEIKLKRWQLLKDIQKLKDRLSKKRKELEALMPKTYHND